VSRPLLEPALLLLVADREPVLQQNNPRADQHPLELGAGPHELGVLLIGAESHDVLDPRPVVPASIEQHDLAGGRQVLYVALEVPLGPLSIGGGPQGDNAAASRIEGIRDALDGPALARGIAALEEEDELLAG